MFQFRHKFQIGAGQILFNPLVDSAVQLWTEVIFPVSNFTCNFNTVFGLNMISFEKDYYVENNIIISIPLRIHFPSGFIHPSFLPISLLTDSFFSKLSKRKCSVILSSCSSVGDWLRKAATLTISPRKSFE